ncbi:hypothetical protein ACM66B_005842 [Microbotryomycetes sp. NB124-2]
MAQGKGKARLVVESSDEGDDRQAQSSDASDESEPQQAEASKNERRHHKRARASSSDASQQESQASSSRSDEQKRSKSTNSRADNRRKRGSAPKRRRDNAESDAGSSAQSENETDSSGRVRESRRERKDKKHDSAKKQERTGTASTDEVESEDEDEDDLSLSGQETIQPSRLRQVQPSQTSSKFAALRALRQSKGKTDNLPTTVKTRGIIVISDSDEAEEDEVQQARSSNSSSSEDDRLRYLGAQARDFQERAPSSLGSDLDRDEDDFIVDESDDDDDDQVVKDFREKVSTGAQGQMYYLKTYLQWLVHMIVCPGIDWLEEDETFRVAERAVSNRLQDLLRALIGSSAWRRPFKKALEGRPEQTTLELDVFERGGPCEACTMGKSRHSSLLMFFYGSRYDRKTFQIEDSDSEGGNDSDSDNSGNVGGAKARRMEWSGKSGFAFNVGSSCAGRAQVFHELHHWAFTTYERMVSKLAAEKRHFPEPDLKGKSKAEKTKLRREALERDRKEADRCAAILDAEGTISDFARQLDEEIKRAVNAFAKAG